MRRRIATLALTCVGVFCIGGGLAAGSAVAQPPEFVPINPAAFPVAFVSHSGAGVLTAGSTKVTCTSDRNAGVLTSPTEDHVWVRFLGCKSLGFACTTAGAASGNILTKELFSQLIWLDAAHTRYGILLLPAGGLSGVAAEFECAGGLVKAKVTGGVIGEITSPALNTPTSTFTLNFAAPGGAQEWTQIEESGTAYTLSTSLNGGSPIASTEETGDEAEICLNSISESVLKEVNLTACPEGKLGEGEFVE